MAPENLYQRNKEYQRAKLFFERFARTRNNKVKKVSGGKVETRSQKSSEGQNAILEVEIYPDPALDPENRAGHGTKGNVHRRMAI